MIAEEPSIELPLARPRLKPFRADLRELNRYRSLVRYLISTTLRTENTGSAFGFVWWILDPVLLMMVYWFVFGLVFKRNETAFPIFILVSLLAWEFLATSVEVSMGATLAQSRAMQSVVFPRSVIPISVTLAEFGHFAVGLVFAGGAAWIGYGIAPSGVLGLIVPLALLQGAFTLGMAFFLAALNIFFRDVAHLIGYVFRIWYFLSPGIYAITRVPDRYRHVYELNPFATFFGGYHAAVLHEPLPGPLSFVYVTVVSLIVLAGGYLFFVAMSPRFAKLV